MGLPSVLSKPAPASVKRRREALSLANETEKTTKANTAVQNRSSESAVEPARASATDRSITLTQMTTIIVDGIKRFKCDECDYTNTRKGRVSQHMLDHKEKPFVCKFCRRKFAEKDLLDLHSKVHENKCSKCKKKYSDKAKRDEHEERCITEPKNRRYECYLCGFGHWKKFRMVEHMPKHTGEKTFHCKLCPAKFARSEPLKIHMRKTHQQEK